MGREAKGEELMGRRETMLPVSKKDLKLQIRRRTSRGRNESDPTPFPLYRHHRDDSLDAARTKCTYDPRRIGLHDIINHFPTPSSRLRPIDLLGRGRTATLGVSNLESQA